VPVDVFILDITMPELNGIETLRELVCRRPKVQTIMLSLHSSQAMVEQALAGGARGYLTKETATRHVVEAIREVHAGRCYLSPDIAHLVVNDFVGRTRRKRTDRRAALTAQERKILQLVAEGLSSKEIAAKLDRSENTIHAHRSRMMAKLNLHKSSDLVRYAIREGIAKV
jgi:DNA-binding NarL/FixJ family response regulator